MPFLPLRKMPFLFKLNRRLTKEKGGLLVFLLPNASDGILYVTAMGRNYSILFPFSAQIKMNMNFLTPHQQKRILALL